VYETSCSPVVFTPHTPDTDGVDGLVVEDGHVRRVQQTQALHVQIHVQVLALETVKHNNNTKDVITICLERPAEKVN